ncbi:MAG: hypothetical protein M0R80_01385 [Proteobacteria bacterium]|jgi:hypothetical protein|nr:hypothetical protein [Pseudomonadota bacterium]
MKSEKIRAYIAQLREKASHTPTGSTWTWAVEQERCDVYDEVADALEEMLREEGLNTPIDAEFTYKYRDDWQGPKR